MSERSVQAFSAILQTADYQMSLNLRGGPADPPPQGLQADLRPRLVTSIKGFGVMTARYRDGQIETASHYKVSMSSYAVKRKLE